MNIIVSTFPDPDIPAPLLALVRAHSLKQKNIDQLLEKSGLPDVESLVQSPFFQGYLNAISTIEARPITQMLQGEALHHAALIEVRREQERTGTIAKETRTEVNKTLSESAA